MLTEKRTRSRILNLAALIVLAAVTLTAYFMPLNGNNVLTLEMKYPNLLSGPAFVWYVFFLALAGFALFALFQAGDPLRRGGLPGKVLDTLGWGPAGLALLYSLAVLFLHFERLGAAITFLVLSLLVALIINGNIKDRPEVLAEKFWVRNPFSFFLGWVSYLLVSTIAMRWSGLFSQETPALLLFIIFTAFVLYVALVNRNIGLAVSWVLLLLLKQLQNPASLFLKYFLWVGLAAFLAVIVHLARHKVREPGAKPVVRAMDKYNAGRSSQLAQLEDELNKELGTRPGARIDLRN